MIGKASEIRTIQATGGTRTDHSVEAGFRWVTIDEAINEKLDELGDADVVSIQYQVEQGETALIIYRIKN